MLITNYVTLEAFDAYENKRWMKMLLSEANNTLTTSYSNNRSSF